MKSDSIHLSIIDRSILSRVFHSPISKFPGMLPVSLRSTDVTNHLPYGYVVSFKADGNRAFLYCLESLTWTVDRRVQHCILGDDTVPPIQGLTILDVEILQDARHVYVFDAIVVSNRSVVGIGYMERMEHVRTWFASRSGSIVDERTPMSDMECPSNISRTCFRTSLVNSSDSWLVRIKPIYWAKEIVKIWPLRNTLAFPQDGLIFTKVRSRYSPFRSSSHAVFKWKERNTVDVCIYLNVTGSSVQPSSVLGKFQLRSNESRNGVARYIVSANGPHGEVVLGPLDIDQNNSDDAENITRAIDEHGRSGHHLVVEVLPDTVRWFICGVRTDKLLPNNIETITKTIESIKDGITIDTLTNMCTRPPRIEHTR
jgi:hypothetical protein